MKWSRSAQGTVFSGGPTRLSARDMLPVLALLLAMLALGRFLHFLGREYSLVFSANLGMITLFLTAVMFLRNRDWRILPLLLLILGMTLQLVLAFALEVLSIPLPGVCIWLLANPLFAPTLLGFATVLYLWRLFLTQAEWEHREQLLSERLQHAQKLESLGIMAGGIAHDFNNLLTTIQGNVELARYDAPPGSAVAECLDHIETAAERAAKITRQMLDFSGHGKFRVEPISLPDMVRELHELVAAIVPRQVQIEYALADDTPQIRGDRSQLAQVLVNLVSNAVDAIGTQPGLIRITTTSRQGDEHLLASAPPGPHLTAGSTYAQLSVSDSGPGIPPHILPRVFDPFVTTKQTGRGMGLAAALGIVRGHYGTIVVDSPAEKGSTIRVLIPAATAE